MYRRTAAALLQHLTAVYAQQTDAVQSVLADTADVNAVDNSHTRPVRLTGARVLQGTDMRIVNQNEEHPLLYTRLNPREAGLSQALCQALRRMRIWRLTELQGAMVPLFLKGKHVIAHAETGSGKSFGIALSICNRIMRNTVTYRLHTIVLVPTPELALQYDRWLKHFAGASRQIAFAATPDIPLETQLTKLHNVPPHVLVGTPATVAAIMRHAKGVLGGTLRSKVDCLVLDEADIVLRMPCPALKGVHNATGADLVERLYRSQIDDIPAQLVAASATIDGPTAQRLNAWMRNDTAARLTTSIVEHSIPSTIAFYFFVVPAAVAMLRALELTLRLIFHDAPTARVLVFAEDPQAVAAEICRMPALRGNGCFEAELVAATSDAELIAGPNARRRIKAANREIFPLDDSAMSRLNTGKLRIGVAARGVARGLHIKDVSHVVLFGGEPSSTEFVHCAGRTGRMGRSGDVVSIIPPAAARGVRSLCQTLDIPWRTQRTADLERLVATLDARGDVEDVVEDMRASARMAEDSAETQDLRLLRLRDQALPSVVPLSADVERTADAADHGVAPEGSADPEADPEAAVEAMFY